MKLWRVCTMEKCLRNNRSKRRITIQVIVDIVLWFAVGVPNLYLFVAGVPYDRGFFCDDETIRYPNKPESISTPTLALLGLAISVAVVVLVEILKCLDRKCRPTNRTSENIICALKCYGVFLVGVAMERMFVMVLKNATGVLRPNFMDVCRPEYNNTRCPGYIMEYRCSENSSAKAIRHSRQSFPSGHASFSMYIAVFLCFHLHHGLRISFSRLLSLFLQMGLLLAAVVCGFRRITDHKHHMTDVIAGFVLGAFIAIFVFKTLAERIMTSTNLTNNSTNKERFSDSEGPDQCCACDSNISEPHAPTPLLSAEYMTSNGNGHPLKCIPPPTVRVTASTPTAVDV